MKLSEINQADIKVISEPKSRSVATPAQLKLSDIDPSQVKVIEDPGVIGKAIDTLERYGSAPMRSAYGAVQKGLFERGIPMDVVGGVKAAYEQFGADPSKAPTAAELVEQNPIGKVFSNKGIQEAFANTPAGSAIKMGLLPFVGNERAKEVAGKAPKKALEFLVGAETDPVSYVPGAVFEKPLVQGAKIVGKTAGALGRGGAYLAEQTTGIPRRVWANYGKRAKEIGKLAKDYVGESRYNQAFTDFRNTIGDAIVGRKNQLNEMIDKGLSGASRSSKIPVEPILKELDVAVRGLHPVTEASAINEIQGLKNIVRELAPEGKMSAWDTYKLQRYFHNRSMNAFAEGGQIFNPSSQAAKAAKSARYKTTELVNKLFPDTIKKANQEFVLLHNIDDIIPPSMLDPNASVAALRRAALDPNSKERKGLAQLSQFLHGDDRLVQGALDLATFEKTTNLPINPLSGGGTTSTSRTLLGGGVGLLGEASDDPQLKWAARGAGAMIASPALLKLAIDAGLTVPRTAKSIGGSGGLLERGADKIAPVVSALEKRMQGAGRATKEFIKDEEGAFKPEELLKILKPGEENVFDLKKARGMAGEPKRGLLNTKDNPVAPIDRLSDEDLALYEELRKKAVREGHDLTPGEVAFIKKLSESPRIKDHRITQMDMKELVSTALEPDSGYPAQFKKRAEVKRAKELELAPQKSEQPRGLLTNLKVERGPVKELPEAGDIRDLVRENTGDLWVGGLRKGGIFKAKAGPLKGQEFTVTGRTKDASEATGWNTAHEVKTKDGKSHWFNSSEIYWMEKPDTDSFSVFASAEALADEEKRLARIREEMNIHIERAKAAKTAEAERIRKGLIGVDFGGRGGKMPKAKVDDVWADYIPHFPKSGPKLNQKVSFGDSTYGSRQGKVVGRDGRNYIVDDGRMTHSVRPEDIAKPKPKGKPKKKK